MSDARQVRGAQVAGDSRCHWVFQTPTASYHLIAATTGAAVIAEVLGDQRPAVWGVIAGGKVALAQIS